ncbi:MAG: hypothetical protein QW051_04655 [Candidatus Aenigmatarchaeota archaeon]
MNRTLEVRKFVILILFSLTFGSVLAQQQPNNESGISIFGFIEQISGKRNFDITVKLTFDVIADGKRKLFSTYFDMKVVNLESFTFVIKEPEILKGITIKYDLFTKKAEYSYSKHKVTETFKAELNQTASMIQNITDFLSSPLFESKQVPNGIEFRPKNFQVLSRFGVQPIIVLLQMKNNIPEKIEIKNDKTDEKITLIFEKFIAKGG